MKDRKKLAAKRLGAKRKRMLGPELLRGVGRPKNPLLESRRRGEILAVAAKLFAEHGFANVQVQAIADRLGVGNGTVYRYFATKEELFLKAVEVGLRDLEAELDGVLADPVVTPVGQIEAAVRTYLRFFARRPEMAELFVQERAAFPKNHRPLYFSDTELDEARKCKHAELFAALVASGRLRPIPSERFFNVVGDLLYGTILTNLLTGRPADPDVQAADVLDVIFYGVLTPEGGR